MPTLDALLIKAVPRLEADDKKARKLRGQLIKLGGAVWRKGPRRLKKMGLDPDGYRELDTSDEDAFLEGVRDCLGDKGFLRFMVAVKKTLAKKLAEKKEGAAKPKPKPKPKPEPVLDVPAELTMSDHGDGSGEALAIPGDDELSLPPELELPADDDGGEEVPELDLDNLTLMGGDPEPQAAQPMGIRFGDDGSGGDDDDSDPAMAADRALGRYRRSGDKDELKRAQSLFKKAHKSAENPISRGAARGGLALTYLVQGDLEKAKQHAKAALKDFPSEPRATAVLCRVKWPKEAEREQLQASLYRASQAVSQGDIKEAESAAKGLDKAFPKEPFGALIRLALACDRDKDVDGALKKAWKAYPPSDAYADMQLGAGLDMPIIRGCIGWLEDQVKEKAEVRGKTVKDVTEKSNVVAGAMQIAHGVARAALAGRPGLSKDDEQQLRMLIGHATFWAQHYDHAVEIYTSARKFNRESDLLPEINKAETQCGVMKRSFDKPGVKNKMGKFDGVGIKAYRKAIAARLERTLKAAEGDRQKVDGDESKLVEAILADPGRKKKLKKRAEKAGQDDPFARIDALEAAGAAPPKEEKKKGGLFGRMKAAATKAIDKAKGAVNASKRKEALKALGQALRDAPDGGWKDAELDTFLAKVAKLEPRLEFLEDEAEKARYAAGRAGDLK